MDPEQVLKEYFARRDVCIVNVTTPETRIVNGSTSLLLFDPREPPVFDRGSKTLYTLDLHLWDRHYRHRADPTALSIDERVRHIASLVAVGISDSRVPKTGLPFHFYIENGYRSWRDAAVRFRKQYAIAGR